MKKTKSTTKTIKTTRRQYADSHWLIFATEGIVTLVFGWFVIFTGVTDLFALLPFVGCVLLAIGAIEIFNVLYRTKSQHNWGLTLAIAIIEIAVAIALLATQHLSIVAPFTILAGYTILRGLFETAIAIRALTDPIDRILWIVTGIFGMVLGFVLLNSGNLDPDNTTFIKIFGTYMMVLGIANIIYSIHSRKK